MTPIPITFTRQLPTEPGLYLHRIYSVLSLSQVKIINGSICWQDGAAWCKAGSKTFGEWAGPLQIVNKNEAGEGREGGD